MNLISLYYRIEDEPFRVMQCMLNRKGFFYELVQTPDADAPYLVIAGLEPMHFEEFLAWIAEQKEDGQVRLGGRTLADLGIRA